jgi:hypothetical protein
MSFGVYTNLTATFKYIFSLCLSYASIQAVRTECDRNSNPYLPNRATGGCLFARTYARFGLKLGVVDDAHPPPERFAELDPQIVE